MHWVLRAIEVLVTGRRGHCVRDCGCCPLACRHCHVCVGRVVISIFFDLRMFHPVARCASVLSHCCLLPDLRACVHRQLCCLTCCHHCLPLKT
jgi:hypothetical protein